MHLSLWWISSREKRNGLVCVVLNRDLAIAFTTTTETTIFLFDLLMESHYVQN